MDIYNDKAHLRVYIWSTDRWAQDNWAPTIEPVDNWAPTIEPRKNWAPTIEPRKNWDSSSDATQKEAILFYLKKNNFF